MTVACSRLPTDAVHDLALADREPDIPRLLDVLAPARAIASLRDQFPREARIPNDPGVAYVRYKPGVSLTAAVAVQEPEPLILLQAVSVNHRPKIEKLLAKQHNGATGWGVVSDPGHLLAAGVPASDRLLPGLPRLRHRASRTGGVDVSEFRPLRYKPHRRWVGTGERQGRLSVVRVVPPAFGQLRAPTLRHLEQAGLLRHLRQDPRRGVVVHDWVDGQTLMGLTAEPSLLADVGQALARLHMLRPGPLTRRSDHRVALRQAADAIGVLCPELAPRTRALAAVIGDRLPTGGRMVVSHGDFCDDQVVIAPEGRVHLIDFDRTCLDHPAFDLGSFLSQQLLRCSKGNSDPQGSIDASVCRFHAVLGGYRAVAPVPDTESIMACTLAASLRRGVDPFRQRHPAWSEGIAGRIELLERLLASRGTSLG